MSQPNQYPAVCFVCGEEVGAQRGVLDGKNSAGRSRVRHVGCEASTSAADQKAGTPFDPSNPDSWGTGDAGAADPFGKRATPRNPASIPALKDYLAEAEEAADALEENMGDIIASMAEAVGATVDERFQNVLPGLVATELAMHKRLEIVVGEAAPVVVDKAHNKLPLILETLLSEQSPMLVGPSGSGKTTAAEQVAKAMGLPFYMAARVTSEFKLMGYTTAVGATVRTQFREAYEHGGVFLFDEIDASDADALTAFNAALANGLGDFPDGMVRRHKNFHAIAAANTFGRGADRQYVGRNQLDAATLDRFAVIEVDYDEELELAIAGNVEWTLWVQSIREAVGREKVRHIVSPRASIGGAKMLARGIARADVEESLIWKGLDRPTRQRVTLARVARTAPTSGDNA